MAEISRLSRLLNGVQRGVDLSANTLVVLDLKLNGTLLSTTLANMVSATADAQADATQALADAASAQSTADSAQADATQALSDAADAQADATQALSDAAAAQATANAAIPATEKGANNGVATLDGGGKIPVSQLPNSVMEYQGMWVASTNTPTLANGTGNTGDVWEASDSASVDFGAGAISFATGDWAVYNGTTWEKSINSNAVASVNGQSGIVILDSDDIAEGATNKYFTDEKAQDAVGGILTDSATIDFTYNDGTPSITATVIDASITAAKLAAGVAGAGLTGGAGSALAVGNTDGSVTVNADDIAVAFAPKGQRSMVAGEAMAANTSWAVRFAVSGETAGRVYKADNDATSVNNFYAMGIALKTTSITAGTAVDVVFEGEYTLGSSDTPFSGTDIGKPVYLGAAGALTLTAPTAADSAVWRVGMVMTTTKIWVGDKQLNGIN